MREIKNFILKQIAIHEKIMEIHEVFPKQWHEGQIAAYKTVINELDLPTP